MIDINYPERLRIKSNGRRAALGALDCLLEQDGNIQTLYDALQADFNADPHEFFLKTVIPLIPKHMLDTDEGDSSPEGKAARLRQALEAMKVATASLEDQAREAGVGVEE